MADYLKRTLLKLLRALASLVVFITLFVLWSLILSVLFNESGLRAQFYGSGPLGIGVMATGFFLLMIPLFPVHERLMKKIQMRVSALNPDEPSIEP